MSKIGELWRRTIFSLKRSRMDSELAEELRQHLELKAQKNVEEGMSAEEARFVAHRQLGNLTRMVEESRTHRGFPFLESIFQDIRYGVRGLRKAPGFTLVAVITLALGIGATTAIFSVVNTVVLRPLPYKDSNRIARIYSIVTAFPDFELGASKPDFDDLKAGAHSFEEMALFQERVMNLAGSGTPEQVSAAAISASFLPLFGIPPELGRGFVTGDESRQYGDVVLLSHHLWTERFGSDRNIAGRTLLLEQKPYTIIGVMPVDYVCPNKEDLWVPLIISSKEERNRENWFFGVVAKLKPGQTLDATQTELNNLADRLGAAYPDSDAGIRFKVAFLRDQVVGNAKSELILLLGAVGFLLLIACANVSNLILSRGMQRQSEIAVRTALGASRRRILLQLLIESLVLSCLGGALGILVAIYGVDTYRALAPASVPRMNELHVNLATAWIALALSSIAGILCGLAPALHTSQPDLNLALKERLSSVAVAHKRFSLRGTLVGVEIALALVLLDGSALMVQSMVRMLRVDAGFRTDHILTAELTLPKSGYATPEAQQIFTQRLLDTLHADERLKHVAMSDSSALTGNQQMTTFYPGMLAEKSTTLQERSVAPGFFETLGIRMISGRQFQEADANGAPRVAIVNEAMVRRYFSGEDPLGKIVRFSPKAEDQYQIIGIVSDTRDIRLNAAPRPQVYLPLLQNLSKSIHLFIRTEIDPMALAAELRKAVWTIDKDQPVSRVQSMTEVISKSMAEPRFSTWLLGVFAAVGLTLTLVGIYGVVSYMAGQRTREIGIRVALGAPRATVLKLVLDHGIRLALAGATVGVIGALGLTRLLKSQLYEIKPSDPVTLCGVAIIMLLVALVACYVPARRATRVDPLVALRHE